MKTVDGKERQHPGRIRNAEYWARKQRKSIPTQASGEVKP